MPMETNMNVGIRPIGRPQTTAGTEGIQRREDGSSSSGFSPRTNVTIKNAVDNMAGILAKISSYQAEGMDKMPEDIKTLVQNTMKQAFSLGETLEQGIGSTLESQRFSLEQLTALSRMLTQMGNLVDKGFSLDISDNLQSLLLNFKGFLTAQTEGSVLEPVLLNKIAFELMNDAAVEDLPSSLQYLLTKASVANASNLPRGEGGSLAFLKQLVQNFMPRAEDVPVNLPKGEETGQFRPGGQNHLFSGGQVGSWRGQAAMQAYAQGQNLGQGGGTPGTLPGQNVFAAASKGQASVVGQAPLTTAGEMSEPMGQGNDANRPGSTAPTATQGQSAVTPQPGGQPGTIPSGSNTSAAPTASQTSMPSQGPAVATAAPEAQGQMPNQSVVQGQSGANPSVTNSPGSFSQPGQSGQTPGEPTAQTTQTSQTSQVGEGRADVGPNNRPTRPTVQPDNYYGGYKSRPTVPTRISHQQSPTRQAQAQFMRQGLQNNSQTMHTMKDTAQMLLARAMLSPADGMLLHGFVGSEQNVLTDKEARQLQSLLRLCQQNVPATIQQAATQENIPDLPRLWAFMQLCDFTVAKRLNGRQLKNAGKELAEFVISMRGSMEGDNASNVQGQRSLNFMLPLYMGENETAYPTYIHVFDEDNMDPETGEWKKETWLRLCVLTDNIGAVEITCRVYDNEQLDMRLFFSSHEVAEDFREYVGEFKDFMQDSALRLNDFKIGAVGERRFM